MKLFEKAQIPDKALRFDNQVLRKLINNRLSFISLIYIALSVLLGIFGYLFIPDKTPMANRQIIELGATKPGFSIDMLIIEKDEIQPSKGLLPGILSGMPDRYRYIPVSEHRYSDGVLTVIVYDGPDSTGGMLMTFKVTEAQASMMIRKMTFILGTDHFGRDLFSRLVIGSRVSLSVGLIAVLISLLLGVTAGALGGFYRGWVDRLIVWLINVAWSIPTLLLVIAITFALGKGFWQVFIAVGFTMWVEVARITRGQVMAVREKEYIEAARALGFSNFRIILRHILPNISGPIIVISAANFAAAILIEAGLSFLGIGVQPPMPSWGSMIRENYPYLLLDATHLAIVPGIAIMLIVLSFMVLGNGLRDALDVKSQKTGQF